MVTPIRGGERREVDVLLTSRVGGHEVRVGIEACKWSRPATVEWVERMIGKHHDLPTDKLVLYSGSGFTRGALAKAEEHNITAIAAKQVSANEMERALVRGLQSVWQKVLQLRPEQGKVWVRRPDDSVVWFKAPHDLALFLAEGQLFGFTLSESVVQKLNAQMAQVIEQINLRDIAESVDQRFVVVWEPFSVIIDGQEHRLHARHDADPARPEFHPIEKVEITGKATIDVQRVDLTHARLGSVRVAYGAMTLRGRSGLIVASDASGAELATIRLTGGMEMTKTVAAVDDQHDRYQEADAAWCGGDGNGA